MEFLDEEEDYEKVEKCKRVVVVVFVLRLIIMIGVRFGMWLLYEIFT